MSRPEGLEEHVEKINSELNWGSTSHAGAGQNTQNWFRCEEVHTAHSEDIVREFKSIPTTLQASADVCSTWLPQSEPWDKTQKNAADVRSTWLLQRGH